MYTKMYVDGEARSTLPRCWCFISSTRHRAFCYFFFKNEWTNPARKPCIFPGIKKTKKVQERPRKTMKNDLFWTFQWSRKMVFSNWIDKNVKSSNLERWSLYLSSDPERWSFQIGKVEMWNSLIWKDGLSTLPVTQKRWYFQIRKECIKQKKQVFKP